MNWKKMMSAVMLVSVGTFGLVGCSQKSEAPAEAQPAEQDTGKAFQNLKEKTQSEDTNDQAPSN